MRSAPLVTLAGLLVLGACGGPQDEGQPARLETVDVGGAVDEGIDLATDQKEPRRADEVAGVLPGGFPEDLPLARPSSVTDFSQAQAGGRAWVELYSPRSAAVVRRQQAALLESAGWRSSGGDAWEKNGRTIAVHVEDAAPGTRLRVEYTPG